MPWSFVLWYWFSFMGDVLLDIVTGRSVWERIISNRKLPYSKRIDEIRKRIPFHSSRSFELQLRRVELEKYKSPIHNRVYAMFHKLELYQNLIKQINDIRSIKVTNTDEEHLRLFEKIWERLVLQSKDDRPSMEMISKRWTTIGFQGSNPLTDFRGMGLLGLQAIEYLSRDVNTCLQYVNIPSPNDYSFAIGVINAVSWLVSLLETESNSGIVYHPLLSHFAVYRCNVDEFFRLFGVIFHEWHEFWVEKQANIMQFERLSQVFRAQLLVECEQYRTIRAGFRTRIPS